jgi:hypothetical protein
MHPKIFQRIIRATKVHMEGANHRQRIHTASGLVELSNGRPRNFSKPDEQSTNVAIF